MVGSEKKRKIRSGSRRVGGHGKNRLRQMVHGSRNGGEEKEIEKLGKGNSGSTCKNHISKMAGTLPTFCGWPLPDKAERMNAHHSNPAGDLG